MGNNDIKVKDLSTTSSLSTDNKLMLLTDEANNRVQNITVENALANIISSNANNSLSVGSDKKLYTPDISGEVGDLDNLITTDKTDIVSAINEVKGDTNAIIGEVVSASKGWLEEGKIYQKADWYGEKIYNDVYGYNHSTFDLSKFTVTGSPTITDEGIASGFTTSDYVQINQNIDFTKPFNIQGSFKTGTNITTEQFVWATTINYPFGIEVYADGKLYLYYPASNLSKFISTITLNSNIEYSYSLEYNGISLKLKINNVEYTVNDFAPSMATFINIGVGRIATLPFFGSIDLKQFSITVDGYPVFNGNKTGIDTIKPADYTEVGTGLTITNDGIASGFSASDYLTKTTAITLDKTTYFEFDVTFTTPSSWTKNGRFWAYGNKQNFGHTSGGVISGGFIGTSINQTGLSALATNTKYNAKYIYDENGFYVSYKKANETTWTSSTPAAVTSDDTQTLQGAIGNAFTDTSAYFTGSIDLNSIKIYVNGNLVYQPCLLIPYNESSTGSKIVDVAYRDRVIDVYEQYGSANYYTIDETNQNATLPMGEIYGFIRQADSDKIYKDLVPCYDSTKAISVTLLGNYTAPADGYVCSPNMVLVLDPDNGYENFNLTIMRNTQSMTMISCTGPTAFPFCLPVLKDDVLTLAADGTVTSDVYFIPREGV